ncbi:MAG: amino-acid N-acetyltransferase [Aquificaceae bacterium]|nr:MAG: amino-acid N-acetyltransferase [Aquificaceae bacterium]
MQANDSLIDFFREAAPYIHLHRGKTFVIAFSGGVINSLHFASITNDIAILSALGAHIILVHGARLQIDQHLQQVDYPIDIANDLRITDDDTLKIVKETIGALRVEIENKLSHALNRPPIINDELGILSGNFITAKPVGVFEGIDYQHTGKVRKINTALIHSLLDNSNIVLLSSLGFSPTGEAYNLRYEEVANVVAKQMQADKLIFITQHQYGLAREIDLQDMLQTTAKFPLLKDISSALNQGVKRVHLINAKQNGGLLLELYTRDGIGTMFTASLYDEIRQASIDDVSGIIELITPLEERGILIKRSREQLELEVGNFTIIKRDGKVIGCAALYEMDDKTGELACLVIHPDYRKGGRGDKILNTITKLAKEKLLQQLLVLSTQSIDWFKERGFILGDVEDLPAKKKALYNYQRNSKVLFKQL